MANDDPWNAYLTWCAHVDRDPYPADETTLLTYVSTLEDEHGTEEARRRVLVVLTTLALVDVAGIDHRRIQRIVLEELDGQ